MNTLLSVVHISGEYGVYPPLSSSHSQRYSGFMTAEGVVKDVDIIYLEKELTPGISVVLLNTSETLLPNSAIPSGHCVDWSMRQNSTPCFSSINAACFNISWFWRRGTTRHGREKDC